jgi:hypothetical protein
MKNPLPFVLFSLLAFLFLGGCGTPPEPQSPAYIHGKHDGCETAKGLYTKNSHLFRSDPDYENGWFAGRRECNPSFHRE